MSIPASGALFCADEDQEYFVHKGSENTDHF
jgi:hypothetical protein